MGTSQSSNGSGSGVPMVPPWVPDLMPTNDEVTSPADVGNLESQEAAAQPAAPSPLPLVPVAPARRFNTARRKLGQFAQTGDPAGIRGTLKDYVRQGFGGTGTAVRRHGNTVRTAGNLYRALSAAADGQGATLGDQLDPVLLAGRTAQEVLDAVVEAVRPIDGTQDAEANRTAIRNALSELLTRFPDADLLNLSEAQRIFAVERFTALDVYQRFALELGKTIQEKAPNIRAGIARLKEVREYIKETVAAAFRGLQRAGQRLNGSLVERMVRDALRESFSVFGAYAQ